MWFECSNVYLYVKTQYYSSTRNLQIRCCKFVSNRRIYASSNSRRPVDWIHHHICCLCSQKYFRGNNTCCVDTRKNPPWSLLTICIKLWSDALSLGQVVFGWSRQCCRVKHAVRSCYVLPTNNYLPILPTAKITTPAIFMYLCTLHVYISSCQAVC